RVRGPLACRTGRTPRAAGVKSPRFTGCETIHELANLDASIPAMAPARRVPPTLTAHVEGNAPMSSARLCRPWEHDLSRRQWLGAGAGTLGGLALGSFGVAPLASPVVAEQLEQKDKQVCFVWIDGGMSQFESWDPKPKTTFGGPFRTIATSLPGVHV